MISHLVGKMNRERSLILFVRFEITLSSFWDYVSHSCGPFLCSLDLPISARLVSRKRRESTPKTETAEKREQTLVNKETASTHSMAGRVCIVIVHEQERRMIKIILLSHHEHRKCARVQIRHELRYETGRILEFGEESFNSVVIHCEMIGND